MSSVLPADVLREIFVLSLPSVSESDVNTLCPKSGPWALSQVNRHWRAVTLSAKELWSIYRFDMRNFSFEPRRSSRQLEAAEKRPSNQSHTSNHALNMDALDIALARSGTMPLMIQFVAPRNDNHRCLHSAVADLLTRLYKQCHRWRNVHLDFSKSKIWQVYLRGLRKAVYSPAGNSKVPILQSFELSVRHWESKKGRHSVGFLEDAPSLQSLRMGGRLRFNSQRQLVSQSWNYPRLSHLSILLSLATEIQTILQVTPTLSSIEIRTNRTFRWDNRRNTGSGFVPIVHDRIKSLSSNLYSLLSMLNFPALQELKISPTNRQSEISGLGPLTSICKFIQRVGCNLDTLALHFDGNLHSEVEKNIAPLLATMPELRVLKISGLPAAVGDSVMKVLAAYTDDINGSSVGQKLHVPMLRRLDLGFVGESPVTMDVNMVVSVLELRYKSSGFQAKTVNLFPDQSLSPAIRGRFDALVGLGLSVTSLEIDNTEKVRYWIDQDETFFYCPNF
jgi:hypothetical protein